MSHVASVDLIVTDLDALEKVCTELGMQLCRGQRTWKWYGRWMDDYAAEDAAYKNGIKPEQYGHGEHAIRLPGCEYEIGLVPVEEGKKWRVVYDFYGPGQALAKACGGQALPGLKDTYGAMVTAKHYSTLMPGQKPWQVKTTKLPTGAIQVKMLQF